MLRILKTMKTVTTHADGRGNFISINLALELMSFKWMVIVCAST